VCPDIPVGTKQSGTLNHPQQLYPGIQKKNNFERQNPLLNQHQLRYIK
jgi:hypothetical protein